MYIESSLIHQSVDVKDLAADVQISTSSTDFHEQMDSILYTGALLLPTVDAKTRASQPSDCLGFGPADHFASIRKIQSAHSMLDMA